MGGERINIKKNIPEFLKLMAEQTAKVLELPVCGIDFIVAHLPERESPKERIKPVVIEVNNCPSLVMYEELHSPEQNALIDQYLDYVATY
ncbi:hypothetical protein BVY00_00180 [bacterium G20]|nr:hypothetical protein BVY00_00180 [bacterium G20]